MKLWKRIKKALGLGLPHALITHNGSPYMMRWRLGPKWLPGLRVHHIYRSDAGRELHDHPFSFVSFVLRGGYWEDRADGSRKWYGPGSIIFRQAETLHRLEVPIGKTAWTFVIRGRIRRQWGFQTRHGWVDSRTYQSRPDLSIL